MARAATARTGAAIAALGLLVGACAPDGGDGDGASPAPTVTVTVTETPTASAGDPTDGATADGTAQGSDACAADDLDTHAFVFVTSPQVGGDLAPGDVVEGCANVFEAAYRWEVLGADEAVLASGHGTATCGSGCVGTFSFTPTFEIDEEQIGAVRVWTDSARDGAPVDVNVIPVRLRP